MDPVKRDPNGVKLFPTDFGSSQVTEGGNGEKSFVSDDSAFIDDINGGNNAAAAYSELNFESEPEQTGTGVNDTSLSLEGKDEVKPEPEIKIEIKPELEDNSEMDYDVSEETQTKADIVQENVISEEQGLEKGIILDKEKNEPHYVVVRSETEAPETNVSFPNEKPTMPKTELKVEMPSSTKEPLEEVPIDESNNTVSQGTSNLFPIFIRRILPAFIPESSKETVSTGSFIGNSTETANILRNSIGNLSGFSSILNLNDRYFESESTPIRTKAHFTSTQLTIIQDLSKSVTTERQDLNTVKNTQISTEEETKSS